MTKTPPVININKSPFLYKTERIIPIKITTPKKFLTVALFFKV
jgi:hypothetical protein